MSNGIPVQRVTSNIITHNNGDVRAIVRVWSGEHISTTTYYYDIKRNTQTGVWELTDQAGEVIEAYHQKGALLGTLSNRHIDTVLLREGE